MIITKIFGGLGNQLFQYYMGQFLGEFLQTEIKYDVQLSGSTDAIRRNFDISFFYDIPNASSCEINQLKYFSSNYLWRVERKLCQKYPFINSKYIVQGDPHSLPKKIVDNAYYDGYWQNYNFLEFLRPRIMNTIIQKSKSLLKNQYLCDINNSNSIAIHVRRDDYINNPLFSICDIDYYIKAVKNISQNLNEEPVFYVFTQDVEWVNDNFSKIPHIIVQGNSAVEDLLLMTHCKHNIIANSTFSWWGAWLNDNEQKHVVAPIKWYNGSLNSTTSKLIPKSWIRL